MVKRAAGALLSAIRIDHDSPRLLATQIASSIREIILSGGLRAGERLPATRTLARDLGVSRTTMVEVFERLIAEGLLEARTGAGTYVSDSVRLGEDISGPPEPKTELESAPEPSVPRPAVTFGADFTVRLPHTIRAFTTALPAVDMFPVAQWTRQSNKHWRTHRDLMLGYGNVTGFPPLRHAIAAHLKANQGINCEPGQIFVTNGAQHGFHIISSMLLKPGDKVWFENPGAIGAQNAIRAAGGDLVPLPIDGDGLDVAEGLRQAPGFRLAFVTPLHQQPLGVTMSLERRFVLLNAAESADAWIIEDDYDGEFYYGTHPIPTLKSIDHADRVFYVGTFSKTLFPALRLGYILAPPPFVPVLEHLFETYLPTAPLNSQAVVAGFMDEGHFATHLRRMRRIYTERYQVLMDCASKHLPGLLTLKPTDTGLHTTGRLATGLDENAVTRAADADGITVTPFGRYAMTPLDKTGLVLGFSGVPPEDIEHGVKRLAGILETELSNQHTRPGMEP
ncbi:PLP-dependent aminotransferase family protein [Nisaea acidiphila]|uniref:PLP-dependent aminotransferase family protein n=1 Tax=Nisaea acidiphila TaxID=1862145 RepID=A0A9J7ASX1_9PROT|nr:PLP-dependent aminotransferase family protein [Nisaea acidiphila]UUX49962.1 PLP-dependent aminotransferase family protein [Nisaea acidiphila]